MFRRKSRKAPNTGWRWGVLCPREAFKRFGRGLSVPIFLISLVFSFLLLLFLLLFSSSTSMALCSRTGDAWDLGYWAIYFDIAHIHHRDHLNQGEQVCLRLRVKSGIDKTHFAASSGEDIPPFTKLHWSISNGSVWWCHWGAEQIHDWRYLRRACALALLAHILFLFTTLI